MSFSLIVIALIPFSIYIAGLQKLLKTNCMYDKPAEDYLANNYTYNNIKTKSVNNLIMNILVENVSTIQMKTL